MSLSLLVVKHGVRISFVHVASVGRGTKKRGRVAKFALHCRSQSAVAPGLSESMPFIYPAIGKPTRDPCRIVHSQQAEDRAVEIDARPLAVGRGRVRRGETTIRPIQKIMQRVPSLPRDFFSEKQTNESTCVHALPYGYTCALRNEEGEEEEEVHICISLFTLPPSSSTLMQYFAWHSSYHPSSEERLGGDGEEGVCCEECIRK